MSLKRTAMRLCRSRISTYLLLAILAIFIFYAISSYYRNKTSPTKSSHLASKSQKTLTDENEDAQFCYYTSAIVSRTAEIEFWIDEMEECLDVNPFFYSSSGTISLDAEQLGDRVIDHCNYSAVEWNSNGEFVLTKTLKVKAKHEFRAEDFTFAVKHDFIIINCDLVQGVNSESSEKHQISEALSATRKDAVLTNDVAEYDNDAKSNKVNDIINTNVNQYFSEAQVIAKQQHKNEMSQNSPFSVGGIGMPLMPPIKKNFNKKVDQHFLEKSKKNMKTSEMRLKGSSIDEDKQNLDVSDVSTEETINVTKTKDDNKWKKSLSLKNSRTKYISETNSKNNVKRSIAEVSGLKKYTQIITQISEKAEVIKRVNSIDIPEDLLQLNVLVLVVDSLSQTAFRRNLPKTFDLLTNKLSTVLLHGYNTLGDAAIANVLPLLTGMKFQEIEALRGTQLGGQLVDTLPFIWNRFEQAGYATLFAEDQPNIATLETSFGSFRQTPVDHFMRPFWLALETGQVVENPAYKTQQCDSRKHRYLLDYTFDFLTQYQTIPKFAFTFLSDFLRNDRFDADLSNFLARLQEAGALEKTLLVVLGDHGSSYGKSREGFGGMLNERLAHASVSLPAELVRLRREWWDRLKGNADRLTTAFDLHDTLRNVLKMNMNMEDFPSRSNSLFWSVSKERTCLQADIDIHFCTCAKYEVVEDRQLVDAAAVRLVRHVNEIISGQDGCSRVELQKVESARFIYNNELVYEIRGQLQNDFLIQNFTRQEPKGLRGLQVVFSTSPGTALFEGTLVFDGLSDISEATVVGTISRINSYEKDSLCVSQSKPKLKKYCICS